MSNVKQDRCLFTDVMTAPSHDHVDCVHGIYIGSILVNFSFTDIYGGHDHGNDLFTLSLRFLASITRKQEHV